MTFGLDFHNLWTLIKSIVYWGLVVHVFIYKFHNVGYVFFKANKVCLTKNIFEILEFIE